MGTARKLNPVQESGHIERRPSRPQMPYPCPPLNRRRVQAVDVEFLADLFQHPQFDIFHRAVCRGHVAGQRIGGFMEAFGQAVADQAEEGGEAVFLFKEVNTVWAMTRMRSRS